MPNAVAPIVSKLLLADAQPAWKVGLDGTQQWGPGGAGALDTNLYRYAASELRTNSGLRIDSFLSIDAAGLGRRLYFGSALDTDLLRFAANFLGTSGDFGARLGAAGQITLQGGSGTPIIYFGSAQDTALYRNGANALQTDGQFTAGGQLLSLSNVIANTGAAGQILLNSNGGVYFGGTADTYLYRSVAQQLATNGDLVARVGASTSVTIGAIGPGYGMLIAGDTNLYRSAANSLKTDGNFIAALSIFATSFYATAQVRATGAVVAYDGTANQVGVGTPAGGAAGPGLSLGSANDTNIYRSAANTLKTDGNLLAIGDSTARSGDAQQVVVGFAGPSSQAGLKLGSLGDTNLYRARANVVATSGVLALGGAATGGDVPHAIVFDSTAGSAPSTVTAGGGCLWVDNGVLYFRSSGTIRTVNLT